MHGYFNVNVANHVCMGIILIKNTDLRPYRLYPKDLKVSDMMSSSAAVLSGNMGLYQISMNTVRDIQIILGINMGRSLVAQSFKKDDTSLSLTYLLSNYVSYISIVLF